MKHAIITGATGAIGMALIDILLSHDVTVTVLLHKGSERNKRLQASEKVHLIECDMEALAELEAADVGKQDVFYHFAWACTFGQDRNNVDIQIQNIQYTLNAVRLAKRLGCQKFIGAGSQAEYGRYEGKLNAGVPAFPENGYGMAKLCAGQMSRLLCAQLGMEHIWTRILSVYGPYDGDRTMISSLIRDLLSGKNPACTKGEQLWDYIYSRDAAQAFYLLGLKGVHGKTYCIGSGEARPLKDYIMCIGGIVNPDVDILFGAVPYAENQVMHLCADISELQEDTGFQTAYPFQEGIRETVEWMIREEKDYVEE